jgi:hypothetical protein
MNLLFSCPVGPERNNCPFAKARRLPIRERLEWEMELSDEEQENIEAQHRDCMMERMD